MPRLVRHKHLLPPKVANNTRQQCRRVVVDGPEVSVISQNITRKFPFTSCLIPPFLQLVPNFPLRFSQNPSLHNHFEEASQMSGQRAGLPPHWEMISSSLYLIMPITGVCLNTYVLYKLRKIARSNTFRFETSSALPLLAMSISDCLCLCALFAQALFHTCVKFNRISADRKALVHQQQQQQQGIALASLFCKADLFLLHVTSGYSVWCWLLLSILRYTAVFHPLRYIRIWRQPRNALLVLALCSLLLECWIPPVVLYEPSFASCYEDTSYELSLRQTGHLLDILFAYVVPTSVRILLDGIVLCYCYLPNVHEVPVTQRRYGISAPSSVPAAATSLMENPKRKQHQKLSMVVSISRQPIVYQHPEVFRRKQSMIKRSLIISAVNLCCNLPSHALRTIWTLDSAEQLIPERYLLALEAISQLLYFAQFTCNALYLSTTIYETSTYPSTYRPCVVRANTGTGTLRRTSYRSSDRDARLCRHASLN